MNHSIYMGMAVMLILIIPFVHGQIDSNEREWETKFESVASGVETGLLVPFIALRISEMHFVAVSENKSANIDFPRISFNSSQTPLGYSPLAASVDDGWRLGFRSASPANLTYARVLFRVNMNWMDSNAGAEQVAVYRYVTNESVEELQAKWIKNFTTATGRFAYFETETNSTGLFVISVKNKTLASKSKDALPEGLIDVELPIINSTDTISNNSPRNFSSQERMISADNASTNNISTVAAVCVDNCTDWTTCVNKTQKRKCAEICNSNETPVIQQDCVPPMPQALVVSAAYIFVASIVLVGLFLLILSKLRKKE